MAKTKTKTKYICNHKLFCDYVQTYKDCGHNHPHNPINEKIADNFLKLRCDDPHYHPICYYSHLKWPQRACIEIEVEDDTSKTQE